MDPYLPQPMHPAPAPSGGLGALAEIARKNERLRWIGETSRQLAAALIQSESSASLDNDELVDTAVDLAVKLHRRLQDV